MLNYFNADQISKTWLGSFTCPRSWNLRTVSLFSFPFPFDICEVTANWILPQSNMAQCTRSMSDSFACEDVVDSPLYRFGPDRSPPMKRVKRLLHDPTRVEPMEKVFSEYDWRTDSFAPTLRMVSPATSSPPRRSKSSPSHTRKSMDPARPPEMIPVLNAAPFCVNPSALQRVPDAVRLSNHLLASQNTGGLGSDLSPLYPTSPISRDESSQWSPLQQFIASCETPEEEFTSSRISKRNKDRARKPRGSRRTFELGSSVESDRTITTGRSRANTWDSDVTTYDAVDHISSLEEKGKSMQQPFTQLNPPDIFSPHDSVTPAANVIDGRVDIDLDMELEDDVDMSGAARVGAQHPLLQAPDLWTLWEGEEQASTSTLAGPSRNKRKRGTTLSSKPLTRKRKLEIEEIHSGFDTPEVLAEDVIPALVTKKSSIAIFASALRHRYVSLCLRIQLDTFRMERKVKRKWLKSLPNDRALSSGSA